MADPQNKALSVFIDADVFIAFVKKDDSQHAVAREIFDKLRNREVIFSTSNYVFAEVVTVLSLRVGREVALEFIKNIHAPESGMDIKWVTPEIEASAVDIFHKQTSKNVSFVDCVNIAMVRNHHIDAIFSFDAVYKKNALKTVEEFLA